MEKEIEFLKNGLADLKTEFKENRTELKQELKDINTKVQEIATFVSEAKGGKTVLIGFLALAASVGAIISHFSHIFK